MNRIFTKDDVYEVSDFNNVSNVVYKAYLQFKASNVYTGREKIVPMNLTEETIIMTMSFNSLESDLRLTDITNSFEHKKWIERMVFDYEDANRWERQADRLQILINNIKLTMPYCGCGRTGDCNELY